MSSQLLGASTIRIFSKRQLTYISYDIRDYTDLTIAIFTERACF